MNIQNRILRVVYAKERECLIASDVRGRVHKFDLDLNLIQSSPVVTYDRPVNSLFVYGEYVFTKDRFGSIGKWDLDTLEPLDFYDGKLVCNRHDLQPDEVPSPTPNRGITCFNGRVYTCNGYNQFIVLDAATFEIIDIRTSPSETFIDCICAEHPDVHAMSDVDGNLFIGNLESHDFPIKVRVDTGVVHGVVYDKRHHRFWTTQDEGLGDDRNVRTGVTTINTDGTGFKEYKLSHEDNEFIEFDADCRYLFTGGFNGKINIFDNGTEDFHLRTVIGPLEFQVIHAAIVSASQFYVLLQTGDLLQLDGEGNVIRRAGYHNHCVWTLEPHPDNDSLLYAGTDQGVAMIEYGPGKFDSVQIVQLAKHEHGFGIVKDVRPLPDSSYVAISRKGIAFKAGTEGEIQWQRQVSGVPRAIALNRKSDRCLISTDSGTALELDVSSGAIIDKIEVGSPSYACVYTDDGRRVITADQGRQIHVYAGDSHQVLGSINGFENRLKRLIRGSNGEVFVTGPDGMFELDLENFSVCKAFGDYLVSTKENGVLCNGYLYVGGYGYQVATYRYDGGEIIDLQETLPDFTKAFAARVPEDGVPILLVGGRGGFINAYKVYDGIPYKAREFYVR